MLNGQLKPGYNIQVGTENNFVIGYDVFPNPTDTRTFIPHLENVQKRLGCKFKFAIADEEYKTLMKKRSTECETVFGQTKGNLGFRRFHLRGKEKVGTEWGLLMLGYDFKQLIRLMNT